MSSFPLWYGVQNGYFFKGFNPLVNFTVWGKQMAKFRVVWL